MTRSIVALLALTALVLSGCTHYKRGCGCVRAPGYPPFLSVDLDELGLPKGVYARCDGVAIPAWAQTQPGPDGACRDGVIVGTWKHEGTDAWTATFRDGELDGELVSFYPTGARRAVVTYRDGQVGGRAFYPSGGLRAAGSAWFPLRSGCWRTWHDNGTLESAGAYSHGSEVGTWVFGDNHGHTTAVSKTNRNDDDWTGPIPVCPAEVALGD